MLYMFATLKLRWKLQRNCSVASRPEYPWLPLFGRTTVVNLKQFLDDENRNVMEIYHLFLFINSMSLEKNLIFYLFHKHLPRRVVSG